MSAIPADCVAIIIIGVLLIGTCAFFQFSHLGYRVTVQYRDFTEAENNIYIDNSYSGDRDEVIARLGGEKDTASDFYAGNAEDRWFRYMISRHDVKSWIEKNGLEKLLELIDRVNAGKDFYELHNRGK